jgi:hypothetical protein
MSLLRWAGGFRHLKERIAFILTARLAWSIRMDHASLEGDKIGFQNAENYLFNDAT